MFITSLVTSNLIFQKFFSWSFFGIYTFSLSDGIIAHQLIFGIRRYFGLKGAGVEVDLGS